VEDQIHYTCEFLSREWVIPLYGNFLWDKVWYKEELGLEPSKEWGESSRVGQGLEMGRKNCEIKISK